MATNLTELAAALAFYENTLTLNLRQVGEAFADLDGRFASLSAVYEGSGANEFKAGFGGASEAFASYVDRVPGLLQLLSDKAEQVRKLDQGF